ncbi:phage head-tail joining protein [Paracoccus angustae]|uniref:Phage head-tail joining protein n=2 Tax=Paracoccus angustae TaxID=1671480 RepID=A0ABV7U9R0_9RHOB
MERLRFMRDELIEARAKGVRAVQFGEDRVEYRSDSEMAAAIAAIDAEIAQLNGRGSRRTFYPATSKGVF